MAFGIALVGAGGSAAAYHTQFVADNCNYAAPTPAPFITRDGSAAVALRGRHEGYQWGGGCWNDNDRDDSPGDPTTTRPPAARVATARASLSRSGASRSTAATRASTVGLFRLVHGPYTAAAFKQARRGERVGVQVGADQDGRARERQSHRSRLRPNPDGSDQIIEAKGEAYGTDIWTRTYRGSSSYGGVRRSGLELLDRLASLPLLPRCRSRAPARLRTRCRAALAYYSTARCAPPSSSSRGSTHPRSRRQCESGPPPCTYLCCVPRRERLDGRSSSESACPEPASPTSWRPPWRARLRCDRSRQVAHRTQVRSRIRPARRRRLRDPRLSITCSDGENEAIGFAWSSRAAGRRTSESRRGDAEVYARREQSRYA